MCYILSLPGISLERLLSSSYYFLSLPAAVPEIALASPPPTRDYKSQPEDLPTFYDFRKNEEVAKAGYKDNYSTLIFR